MVVAPHADPAALAAILGAHPGRAKVFVTESVFSVDGDLAPLAELHAVTSAHDTLLLVDDAHAIGILGLSTVPAASRRPTWLSLADVVVTATLSKSLGGAGGVIADPAALIRHLVDTGRTFIYDTAPPPAVVAGVHAALRITRAADDRRAVLADRGRADGPPARRRPVSQFRRRRRACCRCRLPAPRRR
nr:hypothetical protein GCM10020092_020650 [Actinoplanes digitatis]